MAGRLPVLGRLPGLAGSPTRQVLASVPVVGVAACSLLTFTFVNPFGEDGGRGGGAPTPPAGSSAAGPVQEDRTVAFQDFAVFDTVRTPDWLALVQRVYWTGDGELWALTSLPAGSDAGGREVRSICGVLSRFVLQTGARTWATVSVRASDGSELLTRKDRDGACTP